MSKFDYMNFSDGDSDIEFVVNAKKFTKKQALEFFKEENEGCEDRLNFDKLNIDIIKEKTVRYYPKYPGYSGFDSDNEGGYTYCGKGERGSFPVWVIEFDDLVN